MLQEIVINYIILTIDLHMRNILHSQNQNDAADSNNSRKILPLQKINNYPLQIINKPSTFSHETFQNLEQFNTETNDTAKGNSVGSPTESLSSQQSNKSPNFHNFQKHSVVLIKKLTKRLPKRLGEGAAEAIARRMWNIFLASGIYNKKIIVIMFGKADLSSEAYRRALMSCYFGELCHESEQLLQEAQRILRREVLGILESSRIAKNIQRNRHIKSKSQFLAYFSELMQQLREGPLDKFRLSSKSTHKILEKINTSSSFEESVNKGKTERALAIKQ